MGLALGAYLLAAVLGGQAVSPALFVNKGTVFLGFVLAVYLSPALTVAKRGQIRGYCLARLLSVSQGPSR